MRIFLLIISVVAAIALFVAATVGAHFPWENESVEKPVSHNGLVVHYIDVGQADATLVVCEGKTMLIDGGNMEDSDLIFTYLRKNGVKHLDYVIGTHIHEDHIGGLAGALKYADAGKVYCNVAESEGRHFENFKNAVEKQELQIEIPSVGDKFMLGTSEVSVLSCNASEDENNSSIVLKLCYGDTSFLFMGDAEFEAEEYILENGYDINTTVLKAGHHGSSTSTSYHFLSLASPEYAVISCGKDNSYGHPHDELLEKLHSADITTYRTDIMGDIVCTSDGENIGFSSSKGNIKMDFILNKNTKKYHTPECKNANGISKKNRSEQTATERELLEEGYSPCAECG